MTPERWQQADDLLQAALERQPEARQAFLAETCAGDTELRQEVETLLQFHQQIDGFMNAPPVGAMARVFTSERQQQARAGQTISHYQIARAIGQGGMGEVYLARDTKLGRRVALKFLPERFTFDVHRLNRFQQEARAASALNHPNILTVYEIGEADGTHFIAAEFVEGQTLRALIEGGELNLGSALDIAIQSASALAAAHQAGIIHRDIKPENLMLRPDGYVKVLDFGLAKLNERTPDTNSPVMGFPTVETQSGALMGTVSYMSPEQARGLEVDARTDVFSLGIVLYEMIAGCQPFTGLTSSDVLAALLTVEPPPLARFVPQIPTELQRVVNQALAKDCEKRFQSAGLLVDALKHVKEELALKTQLRGKTVNTDAEDFLDLRLGLPARDKITQATQLTEVRTTRLGELLAHLKQKPFQAISRSVAAVAVIFVLLLAIWGLNRYLRPARGTTPIRTLAVLPFKPLVAGSRDEVLEMGIADTLIARLSTLKNVNVRTISAVRRYTALDQDPIAAGRELRVQAVLEGSIQKAGDKIRVSARLINLADGKPLWARQFDEQWTNIFAVQDAITERVASDLMLTLSGEERGELAKSYTSNTDAYGLYLQGSYQWSKRTREGILNSVDLFRQAIEKDPRYALAYIGLADAYITCTTYHIKQPNMVMPLAREAIEQALQIDERLAEAHTAKGKIINDYYWDWPQAEKEFLRALELKPNDATTHDWYSTFLANMGRFDEALNEANRGVEVDSLSPVANFRVGKTLYVARRYDQAITFFQKMLSVEPNFLPARIYLGVCYSMQGKYEKALAEFRQGLVVAPNNPDLISLMGSNSGRAGKPVEARRYQAQLNELAKNTYVSPFDQAGICTGLGEMDAAFAWMEKCFEERSPMLGGMKTDPMFDRLRQDSRFASLLRRTGFSP